MQPQRPETRPSPLTAGSEKRARFETPFKVLRRRKWLAFVVAAALMTVIASIVIALPDVFEGSATVLVERSQVPESFVRSTVTSGVDSRLQVLSRQILSQDRLRKLIQDFDLYPTLRQSAPLDEVVTRMRADIELLQEETAVHRRGARTTTAFTLNYRGSDPQKVADVTNTLVSFYIEENVKARSEQATGTTEFLQAQLVKIRGQLEQQELHLSKFKEQYIGELPEQLQANLATLERLNTQLRLNSDKLSRVNERRAVLARQINQAKQAQAAAAAAAAAVPSLSNPAVKNKATDELANLYQTLATLKTQYSDRYPDVARVKSAIADLEQQLAATPPPAPVAPTPVRPTAPITPSPLLISLQQELRTTNFEIKTLVTEEQELLQSIATYQKRVDGSPRREQELQALLRDYETTQELYRSLLKQQEQAKLAASLEQRQQGEQFRLLAPAAPAKQPVSPPRLQLLLGGLLASLALGIGSVFWAERRDPSFHVVEDLRAFSPVPVLISLPRIVTKADMRHQRWRFSLGTLSVILGLGLLAVSTYAITAGKLPSFNLPENLQSLNVPLSNLLGS